jgi:DNA polymerase epsilon subunit 1
MSKPRNPIFGLTGSRGKKPYGRGGSNTRYVGKRGGRGGAGKGGRDGPSLQREDDGTAAQERFEEIKVYEEIDERLGFWRFESGKAQGEEREGWMVNMHQVSQQSNIRSINLAHASFRRPCSNPKPTQAEEQR